MLWHSSQRWLKQGTSPITQAAMAVAGLPADLAAGGLRVSRPQ